MKAKLSGKRKVSHPFIALLPALATGILLQQIFQNCSGYLWLSGFLVLAVIFCCIHIIKRSSAFLKGARMVAVLAVVVFLGALNSYYQDVHHQQKWYGHHVDAADALCLTVYEAPVKKERTIFLPVKVKSILQQGKWITANGSFKLYIYLHDSIPNYQIGDRLIIPNALSPVKNSGNPFAFDYARYAVRQGICHQTFLAYKDVMYVPQPAAKSSLEQIRAHFLNVVRLNVRDSTTASLIEAVLINERSTLSEDLWQAYATTGIVHIIAISGGHIAIFCMIIMWVLSFIRSKNGQWLKYVIAVLFVWGYIAITNFPPSAVRAAVMFSIFGISQAIRREHHPVNTWAATGFVLLSYNPYWIYDVGVQLSFLAVLSILIFYRPVLRWWTPAFMLGKKIWELIALGISVQILVFPLVIYYFHQFPLWVLIANIPAAIFSVVLMTGSIALFVISFFAPCVWWGDVLIFITKAFHYIISWMAIHTPQATRELYITCLQYWIMMTAIILLSVYFFQKRKGMLFTGLVTVVALLSLFVYDHHVALRQEKIIVYNVSRKSMIDHIRGKQVILSGVEEDTLDNKSIVYNLLPARLGTRTATHSLKTRQEQLWRIGNKTILHLNSNCSPDVNAVFKTDYLIVSDPIRLDVQSWKRTFQPEMVIIDGSVPRWKGLQWRAALEKEGIRVHWVRDDGAWVFSK